VGDAVLVSGGYRDRSLADLVLKEGRTLITLEPDAAKMNDTNGILDSMAVAASKTGMWAKMLDSDEIVTVGPGKLPKLVPTSNVSATVSKAIENARAQKVDNPELFVAQESAEAHGLEIRVNIRLVE